MKIIVYDLDGALGPLTTSCKLKWTDESIERASRENIIVMVEWEDDEVEE